MSRKIIGITVGTPMNPEKIASPSDAQIKEAVNDYLDKNPVTGGATAEQAQQIDKNKTDISNLSSTVKNKLDSSELTTAIDTALSLAKDSGEFNGKDGKTPVKGTDYFTESDKQEIVSAIFSQVTNGNEVAY